MTAGLEDRLDRENAGEEPVLPPGEVPESECKNTSSDDIAENLLEQWKDDLKRRTGRRRL